MLHRIDATNNKWNFAGHNIKEFDIPFLCRRMMINGLEVPDYLDFQNKKPWETNLLDTFQYWRFGDYKNYTSLNLLAAALKVPSPKGDLDGSQVHSVYWLEKDVERIAKYCQRDVEATRSVYKRMTFDE